MDTDTAATMPAWLSDMTNLQPLTQEDYELLLQGPVSRKDITVYNAELDGVDLRPKHIESHIAVSFVGCKLTNCKSVGWGLRQGATFRFHRSYIQNCSFYGGKISRVEFTFVDKCVIRDLQLMPEGAKTVLLSNSLIRQAHSISTDSVWENVAVDNCRLSMCMSRGMTWLNTNFRRCRFYSCEFGDSLGCLSGKPFPKLHLVSSSFLWCKFRSTTFLHVDMMRYGGFRDCTFEKSAACGSGIGILEGSDTAGLNLDFAAVRYCCQSLSPKVGARHLAQLLCHVAHVDLSALMERVEAGEFPVDFVPDADADPSDIPHDAVVDMIRAVYHVRRLAAGVFGTYCRRDVNATVPDDHLIEFLNYKGVNNGRA